jgi:hypothetical protein
MYNELFEGVIRTSGENTDDIDDFNDRNNFWAPVPEIEQLFEQVLREMATSDYQFFGIFKSEILQNPTVSIKALFKSADFEEIIRKFDSEQQYVDCVILPCSNNGIILSQNANELQIMLSDLAINKEKTYDTTLKYVKNYRKTLSDRGLLKLTQELNTDLQNNQINSQQAIKTRTKADPKNK